MRTIPVARSVHNASRAHFCPLWNIQNPRVRRSLELVQPGNVDVLIKMWPHICLIETVIVLLCHVQKRYPEKAFQGVKCHCIQMYFYNVQIFLLIHTSMIGKLVRVVKGKNKINTVVLWDSCIIINVYSNVLFVFAYNKQTKLTQPILYRICQEAQLSYCSHVQTPTRLELDSFLPCSVMII